MSYIDLFTSTVPADLCPVLPHETSHSIAACAILDLKKKKEQYIELPQTHHL